MEERRFDDLTRVLGAATSRRQVLKGVISGVIAFAIGRSAKPSVAEAAPVEVCDRLKCEQQAVADWQNCNSSCKAIICHRARPFGMPNLCLACLATCQLNYEIAARDCRESGCSGGEQCCSANCTDVRSDPNNCGTCGNVCDKGAECSGGECQCPDDETVCDGTCTDTETDPNHCGNCDTTCDTCEHCVGGTCAPIQCNGDEVCCQNQCIAACPNGFLPDPTTCQCNPCLGDATDGNSCGTDEICCGQQCVSNQCPQGMEYQLSRCSCICSTVTCQPNAHQDPTTCQCVCDPITCDPGQVQDPDTCQCVASCDNVTCDTCQTCDPSTGSCVPVGDNTDCGGGNVCCNGTCQADCTCPGLTCKNGDCCANTTDFACCDDGCCPQVVIQGGAGKGAFCLAPGSETLPGEGITAGNCCQPDKLMKLSVIDPTTTECACDEPDDNLGVYCDGNMPTEYFGSTPCSCGPWFPS